MSGSMKRFSPQVIIHVFALLHVLTTVLCQTFAVNDELLLTLLTMSMLLLLCVKKGLNVEFSAAIMIVVNTLCYFLGNEGAMFVGQVISSETLTHAIVTFCSTEIVGWLSLWAASALRKLQGEPENASDGFSSSRIVWLLIVVGVIFVVRLIMVVLSSFSLFQAGSFSYMTDMLGIFISSPSTLIIAFLAEVVLVSVTRRTGILKRHPVGGYTLVAMFVILISVLSAGYVGWWGPESLGEILDNAQMAQLVMIAMVTNVVMFAVAYLVDVVLSSRSVIREEQAKRHQAQFEYLRLKQQVNPHFLFNSLNVLDYLVEEGKSGDASEYIHKLAGMYRYLLQNEGSDKISLLEEMTFVDMYVDLLKVRFPKGFVVEKDIVEEEMEAFVVPCSVQMLVENAQKHNIVSEDRPLRIEISVRAHSLTVCNNLQLRATSGVAPATNVGLNYIRQRYSDLTGHEVEVRQNDSSFSVTIPLIYD